MTWRTVGRCDTGVFYEGSFASGSAAVVPNGRMALLAFDLTVLARECEAGAPVVEPGSRTPAVEPVARLTCGCQLFMVRIGVTNDTVPAQAKKRLLPVDVVEPVQGFAI